MATYRQIQDDIHERYGKTVKTCWIAHVKELNGLNPPMSPNRISPTGRRQPCPEQWRGPIEDSMHRLGML